MGRLDDGRAVFVPYGLPGERVRIRLIEEKKNFARAELLEVLEHSPDRIMFSVVFELAANPSMQRHPIHHADDIGARLNEPSSLVEPIRTTGVPK